MDPTQDGSADPEHPQRPRADREAGRAAEPVAPESSGQPAQGILRRSFQGISGFLGMLGLLGARLFYVQAIDPSGRADKALAERRRQVVVPALRGEILDATGTVMARSIQRYRIVVDQTAVAAFKRLKKDGSSTEQVTPQQLVYELADLLKKPDEEVKKALDGDKRYAVVADEVTPDVYNAITDLGATFLSGESVSKRTYPDGSVGGSVIGYLNAQGAQGGMELQFDQQLSGQDGERVYEISADGVRIPVGEELDTPAKNGSTVKLCLNRDIQYFAQQQVTARVRQLGAEWGTCVVMRVKDAAVLALADSSMIDPNDYSKADTDDFSPRAVTSITEPGSTEKVLTASAVIDEGLSQPETVFDVPAELRIDGQLITDSFEHPAQKRTLAGIIADSMNTGTVLAGKQLTKDQRHDWLAKFGIGRRTGIEFPNEAQGLLAAADDWDVRQQYTVLFGQGVSQSLLQTVTAYQALANDGIQLTPRLADSVTDAEGVAQPRPTPEGRRIVSADTAKKLRQIMETVITGGHAPDAAVEGWRVGGKTGTAEAPAEDGKGFDGFTTSFVGMAPIEDPQYVVGVLLQRPEGAVTEIGTTGTFSKIMQKVLEYYRVPHSTTPPQKLDKFAPGDPQNDD